MPASTRAGALAVAALLGAGPPGDASADNGPAVVEQVAGAHYRAGRLHRWLFGDDYRDLWTLPIRVEVLDLARFGGGLTPVRRVGAGQSSGLALRGGDGRAYTFRGLEKDAARDFPPDLRRTIAARIVQDQTAALHPASAVVAGPLLAAAGVLHAEARLVVLPDDARLGEFRGEFAGLLGTIQEYPRPEDEHRPGFAGATGILSGRQLLDRLHSSSAERVDSRAFLRARLMDLFLGDWDRHLNQWRWAKVAGEERWEPIPEDRDFAFCRFDGLVLAIARNWYPRWVTYGAGYPDLLGITWQAWPLDRELLSDLERPAFEEIALDLQRRLADEVLEAAVRRMPEEYQRVDGARLLAALRGRRDRLPEAARRFYRFLAEEVRIEGTDRRDVAVATALDGGDLEVKVYAGGEDGEPAGEPWLARRFVRGETSEVRLDLRGGDNRFVARGRSGVRVRVVGGEGDDVLDDSAAGGARLADDRGRNRVVPGPGTSFDARRYRPPPLASERPYLPARDWGRDRTWLPWFSADPELGAFLGGGVELARYGFRAHPYRHRQVLRAGYATGANGFRADYDGELRLENSGVFLSLAARATQIRILRFFGFGNDTDAPRRGSFYEVRQTQVALAPAIHVPLAPALALSLGPTVEHAWTRRPPDRFITEVSPYGSGPFGQLGARAELRFDTRDLPAYARTGVLLVAGGGFHPAVWDVTRPFGDLHGEAALHLGARVRLEPSLALRIGARRVLGTYPFHEAAFVGGVESVRGFAIQRFAGDAAAWGSAELRVALGRFFLVLPGEYGAFALVDTGRVWLRGERSRTWHTGAGGGLWFAYLQRRYTVTVALARSAEATGLYVGMGFPF